MLTKWLVPVGALWIVGCASEQQPGPSSSTPRATGESSAPTSAPASSSASSAKEPVNAEALQKLCKKAVCSGNLSSVQVFRREGRVVAYRHQGDLSSCSHPPDTYFDEAGNETGAIANHPLSRGSPEAAEISAKIESLRRGGEPAETIGCPK